MDVNTQSQKNGETETERETGGTEEMCRDFLGDGRKGVEERETVHHGTRQTNRREEIDGRDGKEKRREV